MAAQNDKALIAQRVEIVLKMRLSGAQFWDIVEYARADDPETGRPWKTREGTAISERQLQRYCQRATRLMRRVMEKNRDKLFLQHLAQRRLLYARAMVANDLPTAARILRDEAQLLDLYPKQAGKQGGRTKVIINIKESIITAPAAPMLADAPGLIPVENLTHAKETHPAEAASSA